MTKILSIDRIWIELPLKETPWRNMVREIPHWRLFEICKVTLDNGVVGVGETMPYYTWGDVSDAAIRRAEGKDPVTIMWDDTLGAGLQMALFDAVGKSMETPAWALMGPRVRDRVHVGWWAIDMPAEDWISECQEAVENGYTTFKTKARPWFCLENQLEQLCPTLPDYFKLDLDFNDFGLDPAQIRPLCKLLERFSKVAIWESPICQSDTAGNRELRNHLSIPIAQHMGRPAFETQIRQDMCDGFVLEGGVHNATSYGHMAAEFNKPFWLQWVGSNLAAMYCLHVQAVLTHARWPAIHCNHMYADQFVTDPWVVKNGMAEIMDRPGIGATVDWDVIEKYRIERIEKPYPHPGLLIRTDFPSGESYHFSHTQQMWDRWWAGELPSFTKGVHTVVVEDDGSDQWKQLRQTADDQTTYSLPKD